jgi:hypothetical protein
METDVEQNIKEILDNNLHARVSDNALLLVYYSHYEKIDIKTTSVSRFFAMIENNSTYTIAYIQRCARKVREKHPELAGNTEVRSKKEEEYRQEFGNR